MLESPPPLRTGYRPHLDGVRTLAVYVVLAFHAGVTHVEADPVVGGLIVKRDVGHLTGACSRSLAGDLDAYLRYTGIVPK